MSPQLALVANAEADEDAREGSLSDQRCLLRGLEVAASARSRTRSPTSMLRSRSASVRLAEVTTNTTLSTATMALAWRTPPGPSRAQEL